MSQVQEASSPGHKRNKSSITRCELIQLRASYRRGQLMRTMSPASSMSMSYPPQGPTDSDAATRPRSSTKGPLDVDDDPLASSAAARSGQLKPDSELHVPIRTASPSQRPQPSTSPGLRGEEHVKPKGFSFLLRPEIYHALNYANVPPPFRDPSKSPSAETPIEELLAKGHFREAAIAAVEVLTGSGPRGAVDPFDSHKIFQLLYTRLACLTLIDATALAAQEVKALEDLNDARKYVDDATGQHLVPWELRVLNVRLQALGFGDPRRAVMSYHDLAREAREHAKDAASKHDNSAKELWKARLYDLGIKTAGVLIDMNDVSGAAHHLKSMRDRGDGRLAFAKALLFLQIGDAEAARACTEGRSGDTEQAESIILALCDMADSNFEAALGKWQTLKASMGSTEDEMIGANTAACLLYLGRIQEGRAMLEGLVDQGLSSHTLLFNLSTIYELCSEKNRNLKMQLAERVANSDKRLIPGEKTNADFKL